MSHHNCRDLLCQTPHHALDGHADECGCPECHELREHNWHDWAVYPECHGCVQDMYEWLLENVDEPICECLSFRIYTRDPDNPQCLNCYSSACDQAYEHRKDSMV